MIDPAATYTPAEAAAAIHAAVKPGTITAAVKAGKIPHMRLGRVILIQGGDLVQWVERCKADHNRAPSYSARTTNMAQNGGQGVGSVKKSLASAGQRAGIEGVHPHLLKHTAVTWLARRGVSMEDVSLYTDTTVETLRLVYRRHDPSMHGAVMAALSGRRSL